MSNTLIEQYNVEYNYPSADKLYKIMKKDNITISKNSIVEYLNSLEENQLTKQKVESKASYGHITSINPDANWMMDIYDLQKYSPYNKNYKYILAVIDIFTRKAYAVKMKTKSTDDCYKALEHIISMAPKAPDTITSDSDSAFDASKFQTLLKSHNIFYTPVILNDHHALGIIDRFARTLKSIITKIFLRTNTKNWIDHLSNIISRYNNTPHSSLGDIKPNEATTKENEIKITELNLWKMTKNSTVSDLS
jgi:transposase InsO family protein